MIFPPIHGAYPERTRTITPEIARVYWLLDIVENLDKPEEERQAARRLLPVAIDQIP